MIRPMTDEERKRAKEKSMVNKNQGATPQDTTNTPPPEAIVQAAMKRAVKELIYAYSRQDYMRALVFLPKNLCALANDPAEVEAIISAAAQLNKAEDEINERSEEEDRG